MPLVAEDSSQARERPPWRGLVAGAFATVAFVLGLAFVARATRDSAGPVLHDPEETVVAVRPSAPTQGSAATDAEDAGAAESSDAGDVPTVEPEPDSGPVLVPGPPVDVDAVTAEVRPIIEKCLQGALRFDPSLGGRARLSLLVRRGEVSATLLDAPSPVLASCVSTSASAVPSASDPPAPVKVEARVVLDGLRGRVKIEEAELVIVPEPEHEPAP